MADPMTLLWVELMILQTLIGYCFVIANLLIGMYNIKDLGAMKGDLTFVKYHKWYGRIEVLIFYIITGQCVYMLFAHVAAGDPNLYTPSGVWAHVWWGGLLAVMLVSFKVFVAIWKKDEIYKYGMIIGPIGFTGWSIAHWTSLYNFYFVVNADGAFPFHVIPPNFLWAAITPFLVGIILFLLVLLKRKETVKSKGRFGMNQIAFVLHGITFGYEKSARELLGTPALFKYVVPQTYEFIKKMMTMSGFDMKKLESMNLSDAMNSFSKMASDIGMAEKIKIKWESEDTFSIESINCSTSAVRSVMDADELSNAICPWALFAAAIANKLTGKELQIHPSDFNEIGSSTKLTIMDKEKKL